MTNNIKISVIVPVYNNQRYVKRCINSIIKQTYDNFECIIIDDGSSDNSLQICSKIASSDERIRVYHINNAGVSNARNYGLSKAEGDIVTFVDSDDYIDTDVFEKAMCYLTLKKEVIVSYDMKKKQHDKCVLIPYKHKNITNDFINYPIYMHSVCNKFFPKSILKGVSFDVNLTVCEDFLFVFTAMLNSKGYEYINNCYYYYIDNEESASNKGLCEKWIEDYKYVAEKVEYLCSTSILKEKYKRLIKYRKMYYAIIFLSNPKFYNPKLYRRINYEKRIWTFSGRLDFLIMSFFSNMKIDLFSKIYVKLKNLRNKDGDV